MKPKNMFGYLSDWWDARQTTPKLPVNWSRWLPTPGNAFFTLLIASLMIVTQQVWATPTPQDNLVPGPSATTVNYQGHLADINGVPQNGTLAMSFSIFDALTGGAPVWGPETHSIVVTDGLFNVPLGTVTAGGIPTTVWDGDRYLQITVAGETLTPREAIRSVPIAGMALTVPDGAINSAKIANNAIMSSHIVDGTISSRDVHLDNSKRVPTGNLALTNVLQLVPGMSFNLSPSTNQTYVFYLVAEFVDYSGASGLASAQLVVDGVSTGQQGAIMDWNARVGTVAQVYLVNLTPGSHTIEMKASSTQGGGELWKWNTSLTWFAVSQ